jgi:rubredoxin
MKLSSDIETREFQHIPNGTKLKAHTSNVDDRDPNDPKKPKPTGNGTGTQVTLTWTVDEGEYAGREIRFHNIITGGYYEKDGEQKPYSVIDLYRFLADAKIKWKCKSCGMDKPRRFYVGKGDDGKVKGKYYCPDCKNEKLSVEYDTDTFLGARCGLMITLKKRRTKNLVTGLWQDDPDREDNAVKGTLPLEAI